MQGGNQSQIMHGGGMQGEGFAGQERANRPNDPRFNRRYWLCLVFNARWQEKSVTQGYH